MERKKIEKEINGEKKKGVLTLVLLAVICVVTIAAIIVGQRIIIPSINYDSALKAMEEQDYNMARKFLKGLGDYRDSMEKLAEIKEIEYQKICAEVKIGDHLILGSYEQDNNLSNGKEDIEWIVLAKEDNRLLIISEYGLDCRLYNEKDTSDLTWKNCTLREWMNHIFLNEAFDTMEQAWIAETIVPNSDNEKYEANGGNETTDKVFLLSTEEAENYFSGDKERRLAASEYTKKGKKYAFIADTVWWWLRSPGCREGYAACVSNSGEVQYDGCKVWDFYGIVRPALWLNLTP